MTETRITNQHGMSPAPAGHVTNNTRRIRRHTRRLALLLVVALGAAACGSGSTSPNVANVGSKTATTSSATSGTSLAKFSACMRSHGVPGFPDPTNNGTTLNVHVAPGAPVDPSSPQYNHALAACHSLAPSFGGPQEQTITPADERDYLKAAACVRAHGFANFPDPTFTRGHVKFTMPPGLDTHAPRIQAAIATCRKLIPAGLPNSK